MECSTSGISESPSPSSSSLEREDLNGSMQRAHCSRMQNVTSNSQSKECSGRGRNICLDNQYLANSKVQHFPRARRTSSPCSVTSAPAKPYRARRASCPPSVSSASAQPSSSRRRTSSSVDSLAPTQLATGQPVPSPMTELFTLSKSSCMDGQSLSLASSPSSSTLKASKEDIITKDGVNESSDGFKHEEIEAKAKLPDKENSDAVTKGSEDDDDALGSTWYMMEKLPEKPTRKEIWKEACKQSHLGFPMAVTNMLWFARYMVSTAFLREMGGLELAAGSLALTFANVAGWSVLVGLARGMEGICSQAYGARRWDVLDTTLRRGFMILFLATIPISGAWYKADTLLLHLGQTPELAKAAQNYLFYMMPDLLAICFIAPLRIFLRSQCITKPVLLFSFIALCVHASLNYLFVLRFGMGAEGTAVAICATDFTLALMLGIYVLCIKQSQFMNSPTRAAPTSLTWGSLLKLSVPSCLMTCLEGWCYEILLLLTGLLPQAREAIETVAIVLNGDALVYALEVALVTCVCSRVGNELGAKRPDRAYHAVVVALCFSMALGFGGAGWLLLSSQMGWGRFFTKDVKVLKSLAQLLPIIAFIKLANVPQNAACGVLRGSARPALGLLLNLGAFYLVGIPLSILLGFNYGMGLLGLWIGLAIAAVTNAIITVAVVLHTNWAFQTLRAYKLTRQHIPPAQRSSKKADEQPDNNMNAKPYSIIPGDELFLSSKQKDGFSKVNVSSDQELNLMTFERPLARLKELSGEDSELLRKDFENKYPKMVDDQFADGNWKLLKTLSGRQAFGKDYGSLKDGHVRDGHCWEVSMSMMNESVKNCAMLARLEDDPSAPSQRKGELATSKGMKKTGCSRLRLFSSKKSQHSHKQVSECRKTA